MRARSFANLARAAALVLDGTEDESNTSTSGESSAKKGRFVPYDEDAEDGVLLDGTTRSRKAHHSFIAQKLFAGAETELNSASDQSFEPMMQMSLGPVLASPLSPEYKMATFQPSEARRAKPCICFSDNAPSKNDFEAFTAEDAFDVTISSTMCESSVVHSEYNAVNFVPPLEQRRNVLVLPTFRELMQEQLSLTGSSSNAHSQALSYTISPTIDIPRHLLSGFLSKLSSDDMLRTVVMRTYYTALSETILSSDPSSPSGAGPTGLSLVQFREFGRACCAAARPAVEEQGVRLRQQLLTSIFECAAKPFQYLSIPAFCVALGLLAQAIRPVTAAQAIRPVAQHTQAACCTTTDEKSLSLSTLIEKVRWLSDAVLPLYIKSALPIWADPDADLPWLDTRCQRLMLEYGKITRDIFDIFSVAPGDEIASILRRGSSLTHRQSSATLPDTTSHSPTPPKSALPKEDLHAAAASRRPTTAASRPTRAAVTFVESSPVGRRPSARRPSAPSPPDASLAAPGDEGGMLLTPLQRLRRYGFDFPPSAETPSYFLQGCDQHRILPLSTLLRIVNAMSVPNITTDDVTVAAKAASLMFRQHPFRRIAATMEQAQSRAAASRKAGGAGPPPAVASLFTSGVNPLSRFVPSGDIFLLEKEFADVLLRLSVLAFPDLVESPTFIPRRAKRQSTAERRRSSVGGTTAHQPIGNDELTPKTSNLLDALRERDVLVSTSANPQEHQRFHCFDAFHRMLTTYVEGFYLSATGAGSIDASRMIVVSADDVLRLEERTVTTKPSFVATNGVLPPALCSDTVMESACLSSFALALPQVKSLAVIHSDDAVDYFFHSDQNRHNVPGWDPRQHPNIVSESGGMAVAQGHLMIEATGCFMLLEGRVALRAHQVLASALSQGKKLSSVEEASQLPTMCEFRIPPITSLFGQKFIRHHLEPHRAVRCSRDGSNTFRMFPYTFTSLSVQYSSDGVHWTPVVPDRLHLPPGSLPIDGVSSARFQAGRLIIKQVHPTHVVPTPLGQALQIIFRVYARFQEVVKEDVISAGKWRHLCASLFYVVQNNSGEPLACVMEPSAEALAKRRSSGASHHQGEHVAERGENVKDCRCAGCRVNAVTQWKRAAPAMRLETSMATPHGQTTRTAAARAPSMGGMSAGVHIFDPARNVPQVTNHHVYEAFEKHSEQRTVHARSDPKASFSSTEATTYRVLTFEGVLGALVDMIINHNTTCNREPLPISATEKLMMPSGWWMTLYGVIVLEAERRQEWLCTSKSESSQVDSRDLQVLVGNPHSQLAYQCLWALDKSHLPVTMDAADASAQRSLIDLTTTFMSVARHVRSVSVFHHGSCIAAVHDDCNFQSLTYRRGDNPVVLRNHFITIEVFAAAYVPQLRRLVGVQLPYNATVERLFRSSMLPFSIDSGAVFESKATAVSQRDQQRSGALVKTAAVDPVVSSARRFWILRNKANAAVGCMTNVPGQCATISWVPSPGSYQSPVASLFLMDNSAVLGTEALMLFKHFVDSAMFMQEVQDDADRSRRWVRSERTLRGHLEQRGLSLDPVFP